MKVIIIKCGCGDKYSGIQKHMVTAWPVARFPECLVFLQQQEALTLHHSCIPLTLNLLVKIDIMMNCLNSG